MPTDPYIYQQRTRRGERLFIPEEEALREDLFRVAIELYLRHRPIPTGWPGVGIRHKSSKRVNLLVSTDFRERRYRGMRGVRFVVRGAIASRAVVAAFWISGKQLEVERATDDAFGGGMRCPAHAELE